MFGYVSGSDEKFAFLALLVFFVSTFYQVWQMKRYNNEEDQPLWWRVARLGMAPSQQQVSKRSMRRWVLRKVLKIFQPRAFGLIWTVVYSLMTASVFLYWRDYDNRSTENRYEWVLLTYFVNIIANKLWSPLFFGVAESTMMGALWWAFGLAFVDALVILTTAVAFAVLVALDGAWLSFGLWLLYPIWSLIATIFTFLFLISTSLIYKSITHENKEQAKKQQQARDATYSNTGSTFSLRNEEDDKDL